MKRNTTIQILRLTCGLLCASAATGTAAKEPEPAARVDVYAQHVSGKIVYFYRMFNNSPQPVRSIAIGINNRNDNNPSNDINELVELPSGWNIKLGIPSTSSNTPTGWRVNVISPETSEKHTIAWEPLNDNTPRLAPGQTQGKMSIAVDRADPNYLTGNALITYSEGTPESLTVPLESLDSTPPTLSVRLSPDTLPAASNKLVAINAFFTAKDDYDRMPEIRLESVTASEPVATEDIRDASTGLDDRYVQLRAFRNDKTARIYTLTYSATDGSGNRTLASATVTVPGEADSKQ